MLAGTLAVLAAGAGVAAALMPAPDGRVDGVTLHRSLQHQARSAFPDEPGSCVRRHTDAAPGRWRCDIGDREGSGSARYRVTVTGAGPCWRAKLVDDDSEGGMPPTVSGCVRGDRWSPLQLL